jgi:iron complex transport system substrate-binding protein
MGLCSLISCRSRRQPARPEKRSAKLRRENTMRICSLLPSATEILYAIGLGESILGVSHECDFPADAATKPSLLRPRVDTRATPAEIDRQVGEIIARGESIYAVDAELLRSLAPDLIVTQDLCHVCAASPDDLATALTRFPKQPQVLSLTPRSIEEVWDDIRRVGVVTGRSREADRVAASCAERVAAVEARAAQVSARPRVACLEWLDPFYVGGHWVPEMVAKAGGTDVLGQAAKPSFRVTAEEVVASCPKVIVVMLCGYDAARNAAEFAAARLPETWKELPAVREGQVYSVDASSYFSRPGPRLADGVEILAEIFHPELFTRTAPGKSSRRLQIHAPRTHSAR